MSITGRVPAVRTMRGIRAMLENCPYVTERPRLNLAPRYFLNESPAVNRFEQSGTFKISRDQVRHFTSGLDFLRGLADELWNGDRQGLGGPTGNIDAKLSLCGCVGGRNEDDRCQHRRACQSGKRPDVTE